MGRLESRGLHQVRIFQSEASTFSVGAFFAQSRWQNFSCSLHFPLTSKNVQVVTCRYRPERFIAGVSCCRPVLLSKHEIHNGASSGPDG